MKKVWMLMILGVLSISLMGCGDPCKENIFTRMGDSIAASVKTGVKKDQILAKRKAKRAAKCAEKTAGEMKKNLGL